MSPLAGSSKNITVLPPGDVPSLLSRFTQNYLVALATSLDKSENEVQIHHLHPKPFIWWKNRENQSSISGDIRLNTPVVWSCCTRRSQMNSVNSGVTGTKFTKFLHDIEASFAHIEVAISHSISKCQTDESGKFAIFSQNWLPWQRPLRYWKKRPKSIICTQNAFTRWKDCENQSSRSWDNCSPRNHYKKIKEKKINASKLYSPVGNLAKRVKTINQ